MNGTIVGISGGDLSSTSPLNEYVINLSKKKHPHILFIPTASYDAKEYIDNIRTYYAKYQCTISTLCVISQTYSSAEIDSLFNNADIIYVGGGDSEELLKKWYEFNIDKAIQKAYKNGKILTGISAGTIIWFQYGFSDSDFFKNPDNWNYKFIKGMGKLPYAFCPHYNEEGRNAFDQKLTELQLDGIALENDTAIVINNNTISIRKARKTAKAFLIKKCAFGYKKIELTDEICKYALKINDI